MTKFMRVFLIGIGVFMLIYGAGLLMQQNWATSIWMWPEAPPLSNIFISSILAAIGLPAIWMGVSGEISAARAASLNMITVAGGTGIYLFQEAARQASALLTTYARIFVALTILALGIYFYSRKFPFQSLQPLPKLIRWSFAIFALFLMPWGFALTQAVPNVFPWPLAPDMSVVYGWIFLGAGVYFIHGFIWPGWQNGCGQLLGFLIYDLVLIVPYFQLLLGNEWPENRTSLTIYLLVIVYSMFLSVYYLFIHPQTRLWDKDLFSPIEAAEPK